MGVDGSRKTKKIYGKSMYNTDENEMLSSVTLSHDDPRLRRKKRARSRKNGTTINANPN